MQPVSSKEHPRLWEPVTPARRWTIVGLLCLGMMIAYFDRVNLSIALASDDFKAFFNLTDQQRGALNSPKKIGTRYFFWNRTTGSSVRQSSHFSAMSRT